MRAIDTNVLVRLIVRDEARQVHAAEDFVGSGAWVSHLVLAETTWVLDAVHERSAEQIATAIDMLLNHERLTVQDAEVVTSATEQFRRRPSLGFSTAIFPRSTIRYACARERYVCVAAINHRCHRLPVITRSALLVTSVA